LETFFPANLLANTEETKSNATQANNTRTTRKWANAQRDGRLKNTGGALCSPPQFG